MKRLLCILALIALSGCAHPKVIVKKSTCRDIDREDALHCPDLIGHYY